MSTNKETDHRNTPRNEYQSEWELNRLKAHNTYVPLKVFIEREAELRRQAKLMLCPGLIIKPTSLN